MLEYESLMFVFTQERLVLSILPRFVASEMIADMTSMDDELLPQQFHKVYIHQYTDVRYGTSVMMDIRLK